MSDTGTAERATIEEWSIGDRIHKARRACRMGQAELAQEVGVSRQTVSNWERGQSTPDLDEALAIATATGSSVGWLAGAPQRSRWSLEHEADRQTAGQVTLPFVTGNPPSHN
jgi:DNA-binding XRE family transcriptional regulator